MPEIRQKFHFQHFSRVPPNATAYKPPIHYNLLSTVPVKMSQNFEVSVVHVSDFLICLGCNQSWFSHCIWVGTEGQSDC